MLFEEQVSRKPNHYPWTQEFINAIWQGFWTPDEFNFRSDYSQFKQDLSPQEQGVIVRTLSAIGQIEIAVKTFWANLGQNLPHPSISDLGYAMANSEVIHNLAYEKLLAVLQMEDVFEENLKNPVVKARVDYLRKYSKRVFEDDRKQYIYSIVLFTIFVENISLFSQFYIAMHFNRFKAVLKDTAQQIQYTRNEEMLHGLIGMKIINTLRQEYPELFDEEMEARIIEETQVALFAEGNVIDWILDGYECPGLSPNILKAFVKNRMADSLFEIGFPQPELSPEEAARLPQTKWFEEELLGGTLTDFFQKRPVEYAKNNKSYAVEDLF